MKLIMENFRKFAEARKEGGVWKPSAKPYASLPFEEMYAALSEDAKTIANMFSYDFTEENFYQALDLNDQIEALPIVGFEIGEPHNKNVVAVLWFKNDDNMWLWHKLLKNGGVVKDASDDYSKYSMNLTSKGNLSGIILWKPT